MRFVTRVSGKLRTRFTRWAVSTVALCSAFGLVSCGDDKRDAPAIRNGTNSPDLGMDLDQNNVVQTGCSATFEGDECPIENGIGACVGSNCQIVSCVAEFRDCDGEVDNGCESAINLDSECGTCGNICVGSETCQLGPTGFECAEGVLCSTDLYDLDGDPANGCEWSLVWGSSQNTTSDFVVDAVTNRDPIVAAGTAMQSSVWVEAGLVPSFVPVTDNDVANRAVSIITNPDSSEVIWDIGQTRVRSDGTFQTQPDPCLGPRQNLGAVGEEGTWFVVSQNDVVKYTDGTETDRFGLGDYVRAFFPFPTPVNDPAIAPTGFELSSAELSGCGCLIDEADGAFTSDPRCLGLTTCQDGTFDATVCNACAPSPIDCADFSPRSISRTSEHVFVTTRRGLVVFDLELRPVARFEETATPGVVDGTGNGRSKIVGLTYIVEDRNRDVFRATISGSQIGTLDPTPFSVADQTDFSLKGDVLAVVSEENVFVRNVSGAEFQLVLDTAPTPSPIVKPLRVDATDTGFVFWFQYTGGLITAELTGP